MARRIVKSKDQLSLRWKPAKRSPNRSLADKLERLAILEYRIEYLGQVEHLTLTKRRIPKGATAAVRAVIESEDIFKSITDTEDQLLGSFYVEGDVLHGTCGVEFGMFYNFVACVLRYET